MSQDIAVSFSNVTKAYKLFKNDKQRFLALFFRKKIKAKKVLALNNISFVVKKGESVGFIGRNGAGKSTILKLITGVTYPTSGEIYVDGQVAALLELTAGFDPEMTGRENIYLRGYILGLTKKKISEIENRIIEFAEIGEYIDQPVRTYSSGMKARIGFSINANLDADILIIDEALSVGDERFKKKCKQRVQEMIENGVTVLFVSHSAEAVKQFCTRAIFLKNGKIAASGDVDNVIAKYDENFK
ncbi:MAG: ABC transporter ATP-binding protein [Christensenellales bacterium]